LILIFWLLGLVQATAPYETKAWHKLIHYEKTFLGVESEVDGPGFFLAADGKTNPQGEFQATIKALNDTRALYGHLKQPAACVFVARKIWLESLGYQFPKVDCPDYETWRKGLPVKQVSVVFASAYPNNPASMFGHTFLRLRGSGEGSDLLDYVVNFAATANQDGGLEFALFGVFGGYEGHFSLAPYFIKINEYNHVEARDLWEYPLVISSQAIDRLLAHLWEIESTSYFDYYFFDENCSYQLMRLLEAADPELDFELPFYVLPAQTIHSLAQKEMLQSPIYRASLKRQYEALSDIDQKRLMLLRIKERKGELKSDEQAEYHQRLQQMAKEKKNVGEIDVAPGMNRPDRGHHFSRVGMGYVEKDKFWVSHRFVLHDLLDHDQGHESWSQLQVLALKLEHDERIFLRELTLIDVISLHRSHHFSYEPSWLLNLGLATPKEFSCNRCVTLKTELGIGQSFFFKNESFFVSGFAIGRFYGHSPSEHSHWLGGGLRVNLGFRYEQFKFVAEKTKLWSAMPNAKDDVNIQLNYAIGEQVALRALVAEKQDYELSLNFYY